VLGILDRALSRRPFLTEYGYTIADMSVFAYAARAHEAGLDTSIFPHFVAWVARVKAQPGFLDEVFPYSIDPHSVKELP
jgi:glutathione S-transferase